MASRSKKIEQIIEDIVDQDMANSLSESFNRYAKAVMSDRAIPDVRDGLKPVQRRIIYAMYKSHFTFDHDTVKSATIVGDVIGHYHPHGDTSVYDAMVRLSQEWKANVPLVFFQGNNGSIDNDPAAAYRYTEAKLAKITDYMVQDIEKNTVDMCYTFDDSHYEPTVLPCRFPNLLVNGTSGIGIGFSTNIPTHNLNEIINACIYRLEHKRLSVDQLFEFVKGPDFPTGGLIDDVEAIHTLYRTGQANFYIYSKAVIEKDINSIVITEIPYGIAKNQFVHDLDEKRIKDHIDNIEEIRDESTEEIRIVIEVKENASPEAVLNYLQAKGLLRETYAANMLALDKGHPKTMNLLEIIDAYLEHQKEVIRRRSEFILNKDNIRINIINGLIRARSIIDEIIQLAKACESKADFKNKLIERYGFNEPQAEAIAVLQLYKLSKTDVMELENERSALVDDIDYLNAILNDQSKLEKVIIKDLKEINKQFQHDRRTQILDEKIKVEQVDTTQLILKEDCYVVLTHDGYIKRTSLNSYQKSINDNLVDSLPKLKQGDKLQLAIKTNTHNGVIAFTSLGNYIYVPVFAIPENKWKEEGTHLNHIINLDSKEKIVKAYDISTFKQGLHVITLTANNKIKRSLLSDYETNKITTRPIRNISLSGDDVVVAVSITSGDTDLFIISESGVGSIFNENDIPCTGVRTSGVKAVNFGKNISKLVDFVALDKNDNPYLLLLTDQRCARVFKKEELMTEKTDRCGSQCKFVKIGSSNKMNVCSFSKIYKKSQILICTSVSNEVLDLSSLNNASINSFLKENILDSDKSKVVIGIHDFSSTIDEKSYVVHIANEKVEKDETKEAEKAEQLSIFFDKIDDIIGK